MTAKFCDVGRHTVEKLWHSRTKSRPSCCRQCLPRLKSGAVSDDNPKKVQSPQSKKKVAQIRPISEKKQKELAEYRKVRDKFLKENPVCQYPGCGSRNVELHHGAGRQGKLLTDTKYFVALCALHHRYIEIHPDKAKGMGLSFTRLDK